MTCLLFTSLMLISSVLAAPPLSYYSQIFQNGVTGNGPSLPLSNDIANLIANFVHGPIDAFNNVFRPSASIRNHNSNDGRNLGFSGLNSNSNGIQNGNNDASGMPGSMSTLRYVTGISNDGREGINPLTSMPNFGATTSVNAQTGLMNGINTDGRSALRDPFAQSGIMDTASQNGMMNGALDSQGRPMFQSDNSKGFMGIQGNTNQIYNPIGMQTSMQGAANYPNGMNTYQRNDMIGMPSTPIFGGNTGAPAFGSSSAGPSFGPNNNQKYSPTGMQSSMQGIPNYLSGMNTYQGNDMIGMPSNPTLGGNTVGAFGSSSAAPNFGTNNIQNYTPTGMQSSMQGIPNYQSGMNTYQRNDMTGMPSNPTLGANTGNPAFGSSSTAPNNIQNYTPTGMQSSMQGIPNYPSGINTYQRNDMNGMPSNPIYGGNTGFSSFGSSSAGQTYSDGRMSNYGNDGSSLGNMPLNNYNGPQMQSYGN